MTALPQNLRTVGLAVVLVLLTLVVYWPVRHFEFINYDDPAYVTENSHVLRGFSREGIVWAFGSLIGENTYWHPVTWLSHMLDCQLFGTNAGAHHLVNVCFHATNAVLLFLLLKNLTCARGRSAVVAALFAFHPLQVDSVAWVTERKNVLSTFFFMLTLWAYSRYAQKNVSFQVSGVRTDATRSPQPAVFNPPSSSFYLLALCCFALGLMSKPMLVTVPFVLLLLDYWPLRRFQRSTLNPLTRRSQAETAQPSTLLRLCLEKLPFLALAAASAAITIIGHQQLKSMAAADKLPLLARLANALVSYVRYLGKMIWPVDLAVFYPYPNSWPLLVVVGASLLLAGVTVGVIWLARRQPYLAVGWFWYLGSLVPVIGLVQAGDQAMADRFTYVPLIGMFIMLAWGLSAWLVRLGMSRVIIGSIATLIVIACMSQTANQLRHWRNDETLFSHALRVTPANHIAHSNLGSTLARQGKLDEAIAHFHYALRVRPNFCNALITLGGALTERGRPSEAIAPLTKAIQLQPTEVDAHYNLGNAWLALNRSPEAFAEYQTVLRLNPGHAPAHYRLAGLFLADGNTTAAAEHYRAALVARPNSATVHYQLATVLIARQEVAEAIKQYREAVRLKPTDVDALNNLAWLLATHPEAKFRNGTEAVRLAERAVELTNNPDPQTLDTLAAAYAEAGRFADAVRRATQAVNLSDVSTMRQLKSEIEARLRLYWQSQPFRGPTLRPQTERPTE